MSRSGRKRTCARGARVYCFDTSPISQVRYEALEHVSVTRDFLNDPGRFVSEDEGS